VAKTLQYRRSARASQPPRFRGTRDLKFSPVEQNAIQDAEGAVGPPSQPHARTRTASDLNTGDRVIAPPPTQFDSAATILSQTPTEATPTTESVNQLGFAPAAPPSPPLTDPPGRPHRRVKRLRVSHLAARLDRSQRTVRYWCEIHFLPAYKQGRREWCVDEEDFIAWLAKRKEAED
jgi:Helix-turn-helix domain